MLCEDHRGTRLWNMEDLLDALGAANEYLWNLDGDSRFILVPDNTADTGFRLETDGPQDLTLWQAERLTTHLEVAMSCTWASEMFLLQLKKEFVEIKKNSL